MIRPDLVDCWVFRIAAGGGVEILLMRRARDRLYPGLWQDVSGSLEADERIAMGALREVAEETGLAGDGIEAFYDLDLVHHFHAPSVDAVVSSAVFAIRIRPDAGITLSHEHDAYRWVPLEEAHREVIWPGYRTAIEHIRDQLLDPARAPWFELERDGRRRLDALSSGT